MKTKNTTLLLGLSALALASAPLVRAQDAAANNDRTATTTNDRTIAGTDDAGIATGDSASRARANRAAGGTASTGTTTTTHTTTSTTSNNNGRTTAGTDDAGIASGDAASRGSGGTTRLDNSAPSDSTDTAMDSNSGSGMAMGSGSKMGTMDGRMKNAAMLIQTLSEEKTEIAALAAQQARFRQMGGRENMRLATMWGRWIAEHKAGGPMFMRLIKQNGGDPMAAKVLKAPVLGTREQMLDATHKDHQAAVMTSQMRHGMTGSPAIMRAMHKRANLARKHLRQMAPYHMKHDMMKMDKMSVQG